MFNIKNRHTPMFSTSELKRLTDAIFSAHKNSIEQIKNLQIQPIHQTVRINEANKLIGITANPDEKPQIDSIQKSNENLLSLLEEIKKSTDIKNYSPIGNIGDDIKSIIPFTEQDIIPNKPLLLIVNSSKISQETTKTLSKQGHDHIILWLNNEHISNTTKDVEAFFAIKPEIKIETSLNRFEDIGSLGHYAIGMIRF